MKIPATAQIEVPSPEGGIGIILNATLSSNAALPEFQNVANALQDTLSDLCENLFSKDEQNRTAATKVLSDSIVALNAEYEDLIVIKDPGYLTNDTPRSFIPALQVYCANGENFFMHGQPQYGTGVNPQIIKPCKEFIRHEQPATNASQQATMEAANTISQGNIGLIAREFIFDIQRHLSKAQSAKAAPITHTERLTQKQSDPVIER